MENLIEQIIDPIQIVLVCGCNHNGTVKNKDGDYICDGSGNCLCEKVFTGKKCDQCIFNYYMKNGTCKGESILFVSMLPNMN